MNPTDLEAITAIGRPYGDFWVLPMNVKEVLEAEYAQEVLPLFHNPNFSLVKPEERAIIAKWVSKKVRDKDGNPVKLEELDIPTPWLSSMLEIMLESSGFPAPRQAIT